MPVFSNNAWIINKTKQAKLGISLSIGVGFLGLKKEKENKQKKAVHKAK